MPWSPASDHKAEAVLWKPQSGPQEAAIRAAFIPELFFGGARGGGKSAYLIGDFAADVQKYGADWRGIIFRKTYPELDELVTEGKKVLFNAFPGTEYKVGSYEFRIPNGSILRLRHMETDADAEHYQGHNYQWIGFDELTNWPNLKPYHKLKACLRSAAGVKNLRIRATGNPGGLGHTPVKKYFIDPAPKGSSVIDDHQSMMPRMFIKSRVQDNKILLDADPGYIDRLKSIGDEQLIKAWLEGDWDAFVGQYFSKWDSRKINVQPFEIPSDWPLFGCLDYGEAAPTSFGLATVDFDGNVYGISEYTRAGASASTHAYEIAKHIEASPWTNGRQPTQILADPSMWVKRHLHEHIAQSPTDIFQDHGLTLKKANNDRINGWRVMNDYISAHHIDPVLPQRPKLYLFDGWNDSASDSIPSIPRSKTNPEDVDTKSNDHDADRMRYLLMHCFSPHKAPEQVHREPFQGNNLIKELRTAHEELQYA
jgi:hypothetical protein